MGEVPAGPDRVEPVTEAQKCLRCGDAHELVACPYVKAIEWYWSDDQAGKPNVRRLEFLTPADYGPRAAEPIEPGAGGETYPRLGQKP